MSLLRKKKRFKILLISWILIILGVFVIFNYSQILKWWEVNFKTAGASIDAKIRGWAWGENMGWISMNCYNDFDYNHTFENCCPGGDAGSCTSAKICQGGSKKGQACSVDDDCPDSTCSGLAGGDYGVYYDTSSERLRGYAWSDKVGWICFGKSCKCADCAICSEGSSNSGASCNNDNDCIGGICGCVDPVTCTGCPDECSVVKPPHGWPFPWACVGRPTWICSNNSSQTCINDADCSDGGTCIFSCSGDGDYDPSIGGSDEEDFLDISVLNTPCYSANRATLRAHWKMNAPKEDIADALIDSSGYGNTLIGDNLPILANGKINDALQFDGYDDYIQADDSASLSLTKVCLGGDEHNNSCDSDSDCLPDGTCINNNFNLTVEAWIKRAGRCVGGTNENATCFHNSTCLGGGVCTLVNSEQTIIGKWDEAVEGKSYRLWFDANNKLNFSVADNTNEATITQLEGICFGYNDDGTDACSSDNDCAVYGNGAFCRNPLITDTMKWHHIAGKYIASSNAPSLQLFVDGLQVMSSNCIGGDNDGLPCSNNIDCLPGDGICGAKWSGTLPALLSDKDNKLYIGAKKGVSGMDTYFNGIIDNVSVWSCDGNASFVPGRSAKDIWADAKMEISGWAKVVALGDRGWLKLQGFTKAGKVWGLYLNDYDTFYTIGGYMANRHADTSMDTTGLVANWRMDEPSWTNNAVSISKGVVDSGPLGDNYNGGTAYGAAPNVQGIFNSAGEFDGKDDYIDCGSNESLEDTTATIQAWIKRGSTNTHDVIFSDSKTSVANEDHFLRFEIVEGGSNDDKLAIIFGDGTDGVAKYSTGSINDTNWHHVVVVRDHIDTVGGTITFYIDGEAEASQPYNLSNTMVSLGNDDLWIGKSNVVDYYGPFHGLIDNLAIYNIARTAEQVLRDYNKQNPYCVGWDDYDHEYGDPPAPFDFEITGINNLDGGCKQLFVYWEESTWAESYTYWRCDDVLEAQCGDTCPYIERNVLSGACENGQCLLQDAGLSENTGYCYKIQAHNETGSTYNSDGPEWKSTTLCNPEVPTIDDDTCGEIKLTWGWDPAGSSDGYNVYNSLSNENFGIIGHLGEGMDYTGLMAQWKMNESSWNGINKEVRDSSNQTPANHGTAQNLLSTTSDGKFSYAGKFDGNDDYIDCGSNDNLEVPTTTIQVWIKRASINTRNVIIADNNSSEFGKDHHIWFEINENNQLAIIFGDGTDEVAKHSTGSINDTNWHHVVVVRDHIDTVGGTITFYIDGEAEASQPYGLSNAMVSLGSDDLWIGKSNVVDYYGPFHGLIDNLAIYNIARTAEQIKFDYEAGNCGYDNCSLGGECHIQGIDTNCGYAIDDESNCANCPNYVCHIQGNPDGNCGSTAAGDDSICCYTDKRILPYVNYYYKTTAISEAGESPFSNCNWGESGQPDCPPDFVGSCCPWGNTICFPPVETEEE